MLNIPVAEIILNETGVGSLVGNGEPASMAQHVGMGREGQGGCLAARIQNQIDSRAVQGLALLAHKERLAGWPAARLLTRGLQTEVFGCVRAFL